MYTHDAVCWKLLQGVKMTVAKEKKVELVNTFGGNEKNTGSTASQVALFTERINDLTEHMKVHKKDFSSRRGLLRCVAKRAKLLTYLKSKDIQAYGELCKSLKIRIK